MEMGRNRPAQFQPYWGGMMPELLAPSAESKKDLASLHELDREKQPIVEYYEQTISDYQVWSRSGFMHFGLWKRWLNPFNRDSMLRAMNDLVFDQLKLADPKSKSIADLGCGVGAVSIDGCEKFQHHKWNAFTICPAQVAFGENLARQSSAWPDQFSITQGDFSALPLPDEEMDGAFFLESLCHSGDLPATLQESHRILKRGSRLVVVDGMMTCTPERTPRWVNRLAEKVADSWAVPQFHAKPNFEKCVSDSGFRIVDCKEIGWQVAVSVAHSPVLVALHSLKLMLTGRWNRWQRKHMVGCALGVVLGMLRNHFGYYIYTLERE